MRFYYNPPPSPRHYCRGINLLDISTLLHPIVGTCHATLGSPRGAFIYWTSARGCIRLSARATPHSGHHAGHMLIGYQYAAASHCWHAPRHTWVTTLGIHLLDIRMLLASHCWHAPRHTWVTTWGIHLMDIKTLLASHCWHAPRHTRVTTWGIHWISSEVAFKKKPEHDLSKLSADKSVWVREL